MMVGLDVRKTLIIKLKLGEIATTIPTIEFIVETLWRHYFQNTHDRVFVVDSNDRDCVVEARDKLHRMLNKDEF